jgi:hypothetical protein
VKIKFIFGGLNVDQDDEVWRCDHLPRIGEAVVDEDERTWWVIGVYHVVNALTEVQLSTNKGK